MFYRQKTLLIIILIELLGSIRVSYAQLYPKNDIDSLLNIRELISVREAIQKVDTSSLSTNQKSIYYYQYGSLLFYEDNNQKAYKALIKSKERLKDSNDLKFQFAINDKLIEVMGATSRYAISPQKLIKENCLIALTLDDAELLYDCYYYKVVQEVNYKNEERAIKFLDTIYNITKKRKLTHLQANIEVNMGIIHRKAGRIDSAFYYYKMAEEKYIGEKDSLQLAYLYNNFGNLYHRLGNYSDALNYFKRAYEMPFSQEKYSTKLFILGNISKTHFDKKDFKNAALSYRQYLEQSDSLDRISHQKNIDFLQTKYQTAEKEKQLLISNQKKEQNQNIAIGLGGGLMGVALIGFLLFKNTKRKQRIAEQEREIEIRKTEKLLKEQELTTIDAMISGQEKERQRLAGDLHDSVGATLAAAKLQFTHLQTHKDKLDNLEELFSTTGGLLDQAYQEIRAMAHLKNSGVIAKNGLLPAVEKLARNASGTNKLIVEVQDFGLDDRLENSLEISIFRIIQELVTNIIKHSNASEASISITNRDAMLSIIIEDNGRGFNPKTIQKKDGMGLSSIERRVEHLEGTMEIDSTMDKGTSVLIDIPL